MNTLNRRLRSRRILELAEKALPTGQKRQAQTRKPKTERKKQKSNQVETKTDQTIPKISDKDVTLPTRMSVSAHFCPALPAYVSDPSDKSNGRRLYQMSPCFDNDCDLPEVRFSSKIDTEEKMPEAVEPDRPAAVALYQISHLEPKQSKHTKIDPTSGSSTATIDEPSPEAVEPPVSNYVQYLDLGGETSYNPAYASDQSDIEKESLEIARKIPNDRSVDQLSPCFVNDSDFSEDYIDKTCEPSSYESDHGLEMKNESLDRPHKVASSRHENENKPEEENALLKKSNVEADSKALQNKRTSEDTLKGQKKKTLTGKPNKQKSNQVETKTDQTVSDISADEDDSLPTANSVSAHVYVPPSDDFLTFSSLTHVSGSLSDTFLKAFDEFPENSKIYPTSGSNIAAIAEPSPEAVEPPLSNYVQYLDLGGETSYNPAYAPDQSNIEKDSLEIARKICNDRSLEQLSPCFYNDSDFTEHSNDKTYEPSSYESSSEPDHDLEIENECLDGPHEVALNCCENKNVAEKENVSVRKFSSEDDSDEESKINKKIVAAEDILEDNRGIGKRIRERDFCFYCETFILNFARHMIRNHSAEPEVQLALSYPKNSLERKKKFSDLRKKGNYVTNSQTSFKPVKKCRFSDKTDYLPCSKCLGFYSKKQLWRHVKACDNTIPTNKAQSQAQNFLVRHVKVDKSLKETVFPRMRPDKISLVAKKDKLICMFGAQYLKTHREKHFATVVTRKMRELAKLLVEVTKLKPNINNFEQLLKPQYYDILVLATKMVARFNEETHQFGAPTYAMNIATSIKQCCSIALLQSCKMEATIETASIQADLKTLSKLIEENWKFDISSQAADDLNVKKWNKTTIVPLAADLKLFKDYLCGISKQSSDTLTKENSNIQAFNNLVESTYCRVLLLNRRRPGELQRLKLNDYNDHGNDSNKYEEFDKVLSATEKILVNKLKRIVIRGKRGRGVPVLFSTEIQDDIKKILSVREMYIGSDNSLLFVKAGGIAVCGYKILEKYAKACGAKNYRALTSTRLRKHLATMTQLFTMNDTELEQLATFMGHTLSVHKNNYRLPSDVYQTAKISKLLLLMEDGKADMYQGKALDEIDLNLDEEIKGIEIENHEVTEFELEEEDPSQNVDISIPKPPPPPLQDLTNKSSAKKKRTLVPWTAEQKNVVTKHFKEHIKHKKPPKRAECDDLKEKYPTLLHNKDWLKIKVYIQNTYSKR